MGEVKKNKVTLMPIDSEHSAIFQCLNGEDIRNVEKITITASGGPFRDFTKEQMAKVSVKDALKHPTWSMGNKITIDSATMMNKGFEIIEAHWLYSMPYEKIKVAVHPQSIIHSLVEFRDGSTMAQLGLPDMKIPIQYALTYPKRLSLAGKRLDLAQIKKLDFGEPDFEKFPCLKYAFEAGKAGGTMPAVLNAANEVAVYAFLDGKIGFLDVAKIIKKQMDSHKAIKNPDIYEILEADKKARENSVRAIEAKDFL